MYIYVCMLHMHACMHMHVCERATYIYNTQRGVNFLSYSLIAKAILTTSKVLRTPPGSQNTNLSGRIDCSWQEIAHTLLLGH